FFSSRRRHTRCYRDWSSDVCSSDLIQNGSRKFLPRLKWAQSRGLGDIAHFNRGKNFLDPFWIAPEPTTAPPKAALDHHRQADNRSEERRVGKKRRQTREKHNDVKR